MPFTGPQFKAKHNHALTDGQAKKAAAMASAMIAKGTPEGEAIATANAHHMRKGKKKVTGGQKMYPGHPSAADTDADGM